MISLLTLAGPLLLALPQPGELAIENLHGGWLRALHASRIEPTVWIAGEGGLIRRSTGDGTTFVFERTPGDPAANVQLEGLSLVDEGPHAGRGLAVGTGRTILRRDPADASWSLVDASLLPPPAAGVPDERLTDVVLLDGGREGELELLLGWVVGEDGVLWHLREAYRDGTRVEESWSRQDGGLAGLGREGAVPPSFFSVFAVREEGGAGTLHLYAGGDWGLLLHSTDGGGSWHVLDVPGRGRPGDDPSTSFDIQDVVVRPDGRGMAVGGAWVRGKAGWVVAIEGFSTLLPNTLGREGCPPAEPCASAWDVATRGSIGYGVCALPDGRFVAVCYGSDSWRSPTEGARWVESTYQPLPSPRDVLTPPLREVDLAGPEAVLYAVGHHGTVRRCREPTATPMVWEQLAGQFVIRTHTGDFIDGQRGWIAGASGPIVHTSDGGRTFTRVCDANRGAIDAIDVVAEDAGVAVGLARSGRGDLAKPYVVYLDRDGWHELAGGRLPGAAGCNGPLTDVHAAEGLFWVSGAGGFVGWSDDGGARWHDASLPASFRGVLLEAVCALGREEVVVAGAAGTAAWRRGGAETIAGAQGGWTRLAVRASDDDPAFVRDGTYGGSLLALAHDPGSGRTVAVGQGGYVFELDPDAGAFVQIHREEAGRELSSVAVAPGGAILAGGKGSTFLWHDPRAGTWQGAQSGITQGVLAIVPVDGHTGYLVGGQSLLNRYTIRR